MEKIMVDASLGRPAKGYTDARGGALEIPFDLPDLSDLD
jgi:hypothetical protein